jgi:hypothetical protein
MSNNLNFEVKKEDDCTCDPLKCRVEGSPGALGRGPYGERHVNYTNYINHFYQIELDKLTIYEILMCNIVKMCC